MDPDAFSRGGTTTENGTQCTFLNLPFQGLKVKYNDTLRSHSLQTQPLCERDKCFQTLSDIELSISRTDDGW